MNEPLPHVVHCCHAASTVQSNYN